ncbi:MAG: orotate phosphoribosyltransferase, partial [bacterium]
VRQECRVDIREIWVAVDRLERNTEGRNAAADLQARTGVAVQAIATIRELCDALDGVVVEGRPVISSEQRVRIERYLEEYGVS